VPELDADPRPGRPDLGHAYAALPARDSGIHGCPNAPYGREVLAIRDPSGIGKTTLCRQVASPARERGWLAVTVVATP